MNKPRSSGSDKSRQNPSFRSSIAGYVKNVGKEARDVVRTYRAVDEMANTPGPGTDARASQLRGYLDKQFGQLGGAIIGRKYNKKGKRIN
jgi:hypothetical protein